MTDIKNLAIMPACIVFFYTILLGSIISGCIEPNTEDLWSITVESILPTSGFSRDVAIEDKTAYVATGQYGIQVWDLQSQSMLVGFTGYEEGGAFLEFDDPTLIGRDETNKLIFVSEPGKDVKIFHYDGGDSIFYRNTIMSAKTKGFVSFPSETDQFIMYAADNDDGMKWHTFDLDTTVFGPTVLISWLPSSGNEIYTPGKPQGIDSDGESYIVMAVDQLGVELYSIDSLGADPILVGRVDTEGNGEQVTLTSEGVFAACDDAGAYFITTGKFSGTGSSTRFAEDLTVDHIAVNNGIAALSLGAKGIALYNVTDPSSPLEKGIFPVGYVYKSEFWGEKLLVCSREGLQILTIEK